MHDTLRFITCGSVDDGKSTLIGRLLFETEQILDDHLAALERDSRQYGTQGKGMDLALLVDGFLAEREQGIAVDIAPIAIFPLRTAALSLRTRIQNVFPVCLGPKRK